MPELNVDPDEPGPLGPFVVTLSERYHRAFDEEGTRLVALAARLAHDAHDDVDNAAHLVDIMTKLRSELAQRVRLAESHIYPHLAAVGGIARLREHVGAGEIVRTVVATARLAANKLAGSGRTQQALVDGLLNLDRLIGDALALESQLCRTLESRAAHEGAPWWSGRRMPVDTH
jgi:iron-sulfur cluster repair protein YtfE (RIC family)